MSCVDGMSVAEGELRRTKDHMSSSLTHPTSKTNKLRPSSPSTSRHEQEEQWLLCGAYVMCVASPACSNGANLPPAITVAFHVCRYYDWRYMTGVTFSLFDYRCSAPQGIEVPMLKNSQASLSLSHAMRLSCDRFCTPLLMIVATRPVSLKQNSQRV